jgi:hypothetical protein
MDLEDAWLQSQETTRKWMEEAEAEWKGPYRKAMTESSWAVLLQAMRPGVPVQMIEETIIKTIGRDAYEQIKQEVLGGQDAKEIRTG